MTPKLEPQEGSAGISYALWSATVHKNAQKQYLFLVTSWLTAALILTTENLSDSPFGLISDAQKCPEDSL